MTRPIMSADEWNERRHRLAAPLFSPLHLEILRRNKLMLARNLVEKLARDTFPNPIGLAGPQGIAGSTQYPEQLCRVVRAARNGG